jgi:gamma-glutamylcyclotransferase (GGCT)/AIG2-like uncharacterized protein YtfP
MMISTQIIFGTKTTNIAGTALFIHGNQNAAQHFQQRFIEMKDLSILTRIETVGVLYQLLAVDQLYFSYGSNMSKKQMKERVPHAEVVGLGHILGYKLEFNRIGTYRAGGVASIVPHIGGEVHGVIWQVPKPELEALDKIEDPRAYDRIQMSVEGSDAHYIHATFIRRSRWVSSIRILTI